jgi:hypothetical protein
MEKDLEGRIQAMDEQIRKVREMRERWGDATNLTKEERIRQGLTLELLDGAIEDLLRRKKELEGQQG